jgi:glycerol-3-phosphate O-acyltransferase
MLQEVTGFFMKKVYPETVPERLRNGHFLHVDGVLDREPPWVLRKLILLLSARVRIEPAVVRKIAELAQEGPVVYAMKYRSVYDLHFLRMRFAQLGLPVPSFVFGVSTAASGSVSKWFKVWQARIDGVIHERKLPRSVNEQALKEILENRGAPIFFLVDEKTSRARYVHPEQDPIHILLDIQGKIRGSIAILPLFILYDRRRPRAIRPFWETFLGDPDHPGLFKRVLMAFRKWTVPELLVGEPVRLIDQFWEFGSDTSWEELPFEIRGRLIESINARIRVNRGPENRTRTEIKERVLQDARLLRAVGEAARNEGAVEEKIRKKAESYVDEIAADVRFQTHHFLYYALKWLFSKVFDGIDLKESDFSVLKQYNAQGSLIYVSCHKSHFDYLLIGFLSFINQMAIPYMAAGKNLSFWPVGPVLRHAGAFFIRRSFRGLALYPHVFAAYLKVLVNEKININFYIEGGRSRTGKLLAPRIGMLAFLLQAVEEGAVEDLNFVPTYIGYDQVPEEKDYLRELAGKDKQKESFLSFVRSREVLKKRFGKVYVRFHEPVSFKEFCRNLGVDQKHLSTRENRRLIQDFAYYLMSGIVRAGVVTPVELVAAGLSCKGKTRVASRELWETINYLSQALRGQGCEFAASLEDVDQATHNVLRKFESRKFLEVENNAEDPAYVVNKEKWPSLEFYKNALTNYLWAHSLIATIVLNADDGVVDREEMERQFDLLLEICSKELILDPLKTRWEMVDEPLSLFSERRWIEFLPEGKIRCLDPKPLVALRGVFADTLLVYYLALAASEEIGDGLGQKEYVKRMLMRAREIYGESRVIPTAPSVTLTNALTRFSEMGVLQYRQSKRFLKGVQDESRRDALRTYLASAVAANSSGSGPDMRRQLW